MNNSFQIVLANLNTSLRNAEVRGYGDVPHCYVRADELAALIQCAIACELCAEHDDERFIGGALKALIACDHE